MTESSVNVPEAVSEPSTPKLTPDKATATAEKLLRLKRQYFLQKELSSAADESENLAIEEVRFTKTVFNK